MTKKAILIVTHYSTLNYCRELLESLKDYKDHPIVIAINEIEKLEDDDFINTYLSDHEILPIEGNRWECGGLTAMMGFTQYDEFVLIQDTLEVKDSSIFKTMLDTYEGRSVSFGKDWLCYLGKYRRTVLDQFPIPVCLSKLDAYYNEHMVANIYSYISEKIEGAPPVVLFPEWTNENPNNWEEERFGRKNLVLANDYLIKRKSLWWYIKPFNVSIWHKGS